LIKKSAKQWSFRFLEKAWSAELLIAESPLKFAQKLISVLLPSNVWRAGQTLTLPSFLTFQSRCRWVGITHVEFFCFCFCSETTFLCPLKHFQVSEKSFFSFESFTFVPLKWTLEVTERSFGRKKFSINGSDINSVSWAPKNPFPFH
jgi:hypothetical protein